MPSFIFTLILGLSVFISSSVIAAPVLSQTQKTPVAILELRTKGAAEPSEGNLVTDRIRSLVVKSKRYDVMERALVDKILKEQGFQSTQNCGGADNCSVRIGQLLAVKEIITGSLNKVGDFYALTLRKIDVERGLILKEDFYDCRCDISKLIISGLPVFINAFLENEQQKSLLPEENPVSFNTPETSQNDLLLKEGSDSIINIRSRKPWLVMANVGIRPSANVILQYNIGDYFSVYGGGSLTQSEYFDGTVFGSLIEPDGLIGTKIYFMPGAVSLYTDLSFSLQFGVALLGLEYRDESGFTASLGAGWELGAGSSSIPNSGGVFRGGDSFALTGGFGYAF